MNRLVVTALRVGPHEVAFSAQAGTVVALLGRTAAGPSAVLAAIAGVRDEGRSAVRMGGHPVTPDRAGVMQQPARLFPELTAAENVAVPLLARGLPVDAARIDALLGSLALGPASRGNLVEQLSGGQQQRVAIARALVTGSPLLCLDEPVTELDESTADIVWAVLREAVRPEGVAVIATIDRDLAARCDQVVHV